MLTLSVKAGDTIRVGDARIRVVNKTGKLFCIQIDAQDGVVVELEKEGKPAAGISASTSLSVNRKANETLRSREDVVTIDRVERALFVAAELVYMHGDVFAPIFIRLEKELVEMRHVQSAVERARKMVRDREAATPTNHVRK